LILAWELTANLALEFKRRERCQLTLDEFKTNQTAEELALAKDCLRAVCSRHE